MTSKQRDILLNPQKDKPQVSTMGRSFDLLQAINEAAAYFQRSAHSETAVFRAYQEQMANLELRGGLSLLDETGKYLTVRAVNYAGRIGQILARLENLVGAKTEGHTAAIADVDAYRYVVETGQTHYIADSSAVVAQMLPPRARRYLGRIVSIFGAKPAIYAPLISEGRVFGVINIVGEDLTPNDMPALTAFANHLSVALDNARLFEKIHRHAAELEQRVAERTQELAAANERLMELDQMKSQLISNVSHELRTPITNLELYLELIKHGSPEKREGYLQVIEEQSHRLKQLVEEVLNLSQLEAGRDKLKFAPVQLNQIIEPIVGIQQIRAQEKGIMLHFIPDEKLPVIEGIHSQLSQVAVNLVTNSVNYTAAGDIQVCTFQKKGGEIICLQVSDTGQGILEADRPHIFDRFYRGQNNEPGQTPGTGLGLAIVKEIVEIHGGKIELESKSGQGTTFRIWLPAVQPE